jgi:hypothetical protein
VLDAIVARRGAGLFSREVDIIKNRYAALERMVRERELASLQRKGRLVLEHIESVVCGCLLMFDAIVDGDEVAVEVARRWVRANALIADKAQMERDGEAVDPAQEVDMDRRIFLGNVASSMPAVVSRPAKL